MKTTNRLVWLVAIIGTALSFLTQFLVRITLELQSPPQSIPLLPGILYLTYMSSDGAAFGMGDYNSLLISGGILAISALSLVTLLISWFLSKSQKTILKSLQVGVGLVLAGYASITMERILYKSVSTFIDLRVQKTPVLNPADVLIHLGQIISVFSIIFLGLRFIANLRGKS